MSHLVRRYPDTTYVPGFVASGDDFKYFDTNVTKCVNGDGGGTWSPGTSRIVIGGAGMVFALATTSSGGGPDIFTSAGKYVEHDDNDYLLFAASRTLMSPILAGRPITQPLTAGAAADLLVPRWDVDVTNGLISADHSPRTYVTGPRWQFPLRVHNGSTLSQVFFYFEIGETHSSYPQNPIKFRVQRIDRDGNAAPILTGVPATSTVADANGYVPMLFASYSTLTPSQLTCTVNPAFALVDTSAYRYVAEVADEFGASSFGTTANGFFGAAASCTVTDMRPQ